MSKCCLNLNKKMNIPPAVFWYKKVDKILVGKEYNVVFHFNIINAHQNELKHNLDNDTWMQNSTKTWLCYWCRDLLDFLLRDLARSGFYNVLENLKEGISLILFSIGSFFLYVINILRICLLWVGPTFVNLSIWK